MDRGAVLAKCDELLVFLAEYEEHGKLLRLTEDIRQLRERLLREAAKENGSRPADAPRIRRRDLTSHPPEGARARPPFPAVSYDAVMRVAREQSSRWIPAIRDVYDTIEAQVAAGNADHTCGKWIEGHTGRRPPSLANLERWGVLERKRWGVVDGVDLDASGTRYYRMPDRPGVSRALTELGA